MLGGPAANTVDGAFPQLQQRYNEMIGAYNRM